MVKLRSNKTVLRNPKTFIGFAVLPCRSAPVATL